MAAEQHRLPLSRRRFVQGAGAAGLGLLAACAPLPWQAPPTVKVYRLGYLSPTTAAIDASRFASLEQGLHALGWTVGQNITIERRLADGELERLPDLAAELVQLAPDAVVTVTEAASRAMQSVSSTLPVVLTAHADPVGTQAVASLRHPGGNVTGVSSLAPELAGKRLELLKETFPAAAHVGTLYNASFQAMARENSETLVSARAQGIELLPLGVRSAADLDGAFLAAAEARLDAIVVIFDPLIATSRDRLVELSARGGLPTISGDSTFAAAGGLMSYGPDMGRQAERAAYFVDRILKGAKPADLPVEQPTRFEFVINLRTAQALELTIPQHVLLQATELIH